MRPARASPPRTAPPTSARRRRTAGRPAPSCVLYVLPRRARAIMFCLCFCVRRSAKSRDSKTETERLLTKGPFFGLLRIQTMFSRIVPVRLLRAHNTCPSAQHLPSASTPASSTLPRQHLPPAPTLGKRTTFARRHSRPYAAAAAAGTRGRKLARRKAPKGARSAPKHPQNPRRPAAVGALLQHHGII